MSGAVTGAGTALLSQWVGPGWSQIIGSAAGGAMSWIMTSFFWQLGVNIDAAQLALEYLIYDAMKKVTDDWQPEPKATYEMIADENEDYTPVPMEEFTAPTSDVAEKWDFEVQSLKNVGIEAVGLTNVAEIAGGRDSVLSNLSRLKKDGSLDMDIDQETDAGIKEKQNQNYQWMSTAGIARAELGLEVANQAAVDAGGEAASITADTSGDGNITMNAAAAEDTNTTLRGWPNQITSTGMGMRVQILMNLELAQRVNLANTLQGNTLSIEAARALKKAPRVIRD